MPRRSTSDPNEPQGRLIISDFPGVKSAIDPHDIPAGAAVAQRNAGSFRPGELRVRPGFVVVQFDE